MSALLDKQQQFAMMLGEFLVWLYQNGYRVTLGEVWRSPQEAALNAQSGVGIANSLHTQKLAADLNIFRIDGTLLETVTELLPAGEQWESQGGSWGGRFHKPDADHFSLSPDGVTR